MSDDQTHELQWHTTLLQAVRSQLADVFAGADETELDLETFAAYFDELDQLLAEVRMAHSLAARELGERLRSARLDVLERDAAPPVKLNVSKSRKAWQSDDLRSTAVTAARRRAEASLAERPPEVVAIATGEAVPSWSDAVEAISELWSLSGSNVRLTALRELGIDPDDYCEGGPDRPTYTAAVVRS